MNSSGEHCCGSPHLGAEPQRLCMASCNRYAPPHPKFPPWTKGLEHCTLFLSLCAYFPFFVFFSTSHPSTPLLLHTLQRSQPSSSAVHHRPLDPSHNGPRKI